MKFESESVPQPDNASEEPGNLSRRDFLKIAAGGLAAAIELPNRVEAADDTTSHEKAESPEKHQADIEQLKEIIRTHRVKENLVFLNQRFGNAEGVVTAAAWNVRDIEWYESAKKKISQGDASGELYLASAPASISRQYNLYWNSKVIEQRIAEQETRDGLNAKISGFDRFPSLSDQYVRNVLEARFHKRWLYGNISAFKYFDRDEAHAHYNVAGRAPNAGMQSMFAKHERQEVQIFRLQEPTKENLLRVMAHEIGHHQDWSTANRLPLHERLEFLREVSDQFESDGRFSSTYIDIDVPREYHERDLDVRAMRYRQVKEYWASIIESYTLDPKGFEQSHPNDFALARKWYLRLARPLTSK